MSQFESESANEIKYQLALRDQQITALKLAATEQATHAKAVLEERTRERDDNRQVMEIQESALVKIKDLLSVEWCAGWGTLVERVAQIVKERDALALSQGRLLGALRARQQADDAWQDGRVPHNVCHNMTKRAQELARAAIAEATPEGDK